MGRTKAGHRGWGSRREKGEWSMKRFHKLWALAAILTAALASVLAPRAAAQNDGAVRGQILDIAGKPWVDLGIQVVSDQGVKTDTKTDKDGNYVVRNLRDRKSTRLNSSHQIISYAVFCLKKKKKKKCIKKYV